MTDPHSTIEDVDKQHQPARAGQRPERRKKQRANMHDGIPVWYDCCSCEAEPYWAAAAEEMGMNLDGHEADAADAAESNE